MQTWNEFKKEVLKNPAVKKEYDRLAPRYAVISAIIKARNQKGITQKELAKKMGTKQSAIARLESGNANPSLAFLEKLADALQSPLQIHFG